MTFREYISHYAVLPYDVTGKLYDGSNETVLKGTSVYIDDTIFEKNGSVIIIAHHRDISIRLRFDSKTEAELELDIIL